MDDRRPQLLQTEVEDTDDEVPPTAAAASELFPGYMTDTMYFPDKKIALAVQVNSSVPQDLGKPLGRILAEIAALVN